jgi:hypothetical protein
LESLSCGVFFVWIHDIDECLVSLLVIVQCLFEFHRCETSELIWLVSPETLIIGKLPGFDLFFDVLRELVRNHIENDTDKCP